MQDRLYYSLSLYLVKGIGPHYYRKLLDSLGSPENVFKADPLDLRGIVPANLIENIKNYDFKITEEQLKKSRKLGIEIIDLKHPAYPEILKKLDFSPPVLFFRGKIKKVDFNSIAIVGTRRCTVYGKRTTQEFSKFLAEAGFHIISGGARGVDTEAHKAAIEAGGITFAVMGCGLDRIYPPENKKLFEKIEEHGGLISEFPIGTPPNKENFPRRNRIIAGLSRGILVVEAGEKSGALLTAQWGIEAGKEIYVIPGPINSPASRGTNELLKKGAKPVTSPRDIIEDFGIVPPKEEEEKRTILSEQELEIFEALDYIEPVHLDDLCEKLNQPVTTLLPLLLKMEMKGVITQLPGKFYVRAK